MSAAPTRVLVVDDHEMFAQSLVRILAEEESIDVAASVGTVADAVDAVRRIPVDVVVMDYQLPDGDGINLAGRLLAIAPDIKVLLLTGSGNDRLVVRAMEAGCSGFVTKDRAVEELVRAIGVVAAGDAWVPPSLVRHLFPSPQRSDRRVGSDLTQREIEVLRLAAQGLPNAAIAERLYLSVNTVRNHVQNAIAKLGAHSKLEAVAIAVREGIIAYPTT